MSIVYVRGYNVKLGYKEETTFGTAPTGGYNYIGHVVSFEPALATNPIELRPVGIRYPLTYLKGQRQVGFNVTFHPTGIDFMNYALGNVSKTITIWEEIQDLSAPNDLVFTGLRANTLTIRGEVGSPLTATMNFLGKDVSTTEPGSSTLPDVSTTEPLHFPDQKVMIGGSNPTGTVSGFDVTINNNLELIYGLLGTGDLTIVRNVEKVISVTGSITMTLSSLSDLSDALNLTEKTNMVITLGKTGATTHTLTITKFKWAGYPKTVSVGELVRVTLPFNAYGAIPTLASS